MINTYFISERFFTEQEIISFRKEHGYDLKEISYSGHKEEDLSIPDQKEYLLKEGHPKILARFFF